MAIALVDKFSKYVDELFSTESKHSLFTNEDAFEFSGAHTVKTWNVDTAEMNDYGRSGAAAGNWSRYGEVQSLDATTTDYTLRKDRSFTFAIDALDEEESEVKSAAALARQQRLVIVPEIDTYVIGEMATHAGTTATAATLDESNIYDKIIDGSEVLDNNEVPETGRVLLVTPSVYKLLKQNPDIMTETDVSTEMRLKGVIGNVDGMPVLRVPSARVPAKFGFMIAHPIATIAPKKLADYRTHINPPGLNGTLVEGRIVYDCYVLPNKAKAVYYQPLT